MKIHQEVARWMAFLATLVCLQAQDDSCTSPDGRYGSCLDIRKCPELLELVRTFRSDPYAYSFLRESLCRYDGDYPVVCCPQETERQMGNSKAIGTYTLPTVADGCGMSNGSYFKRVVNGEPASLGAWPWIAALGYMSKKTPGKTLWQCGGTLITSRHVVTAAHCIQGHEDSIYLVRVGDLDLASDSDGATPINVPIEKLIVHEEYDPIQRVNDIAIVKMNSDVPFSWLIRPICLPTTPDLRANNFVGNNPFLAGWGSTSFKGPASSLLQQLQIPVVTNEECQKAYVRFTKNVIDQRVLCAGYAKGGKDACQGDSGGPLMWPTIPSGKDDICYYLIGIVSYGYKCAEPGYPGVYTRVTEFVDWISANING